MSKCQSVKVSKIVIRAPNWLGDSVMSIPTVASVKSLFPDSSICIWTKPGLLDLWRSVPGVDNVLDSVPKRHSFELGILLTNSFGSALRMYLAKIPKRRGYSTNWRRFLLTQPVKLKNGWENLPRPDPDFIGTSGRGLHQIEYFLGIVDGIGGAVPKIDVPEQLRNEAKEILINNGWDGENNIIGIHATSSYGPSKCWLPERFVQLIDRLREKYNPWILIVGSKEEKKDVENILIKVKDRARIINLTGQTNIKMLSGILSLCNILIANDSGPMHLGAAVGIPVVAIFGSTDPNRTGPRGKCAIVKVRSSMFFNRPWLESQRVGSTLAPPHPIKRDGKSRKEGRASTASEAAPVCVSEATPVCAEVVLNSVEDCIKPVSPGMPQQKVGTAKSLPSTLLRTAKSLPGALTAVKKDIPCSPCFRRVCPRDLECMQMIKVEDVMEAVESLNVRGDASDILAKVAVVMKDYDESRGGAERYLAGIIPQLADKFAAVDLIVNRVRGVIPEGINVKIAKAIRWSSILEPISFNWSVQQLIKRGRYDLVYGLTQVYPQDVYRVGWLEHSWFEIKYPKLWQRLVNYIRPKNIVRLYMENKIFTEGNYKKIIANSNFCKNQILQYYRISPEDVAVVYNGVDKKRFNPETRNLYRDKVRRELMIGERDKVVLFVSNNWKRKGLRELMKAFAIVDCEWLIIAGRGRKNPYIRLAKKYKIEDKIKFAGPTREPEKFYGASDVFVLPTYYDPFANVCVEALSCGMPVVTTQTNGASELIINGKNGYLIDNANNILDLADCIRKAFSLKGTIEEDITIEENVQRTLKVLKDVKIPLTRASHALSPGVRGVRARGEGHVLINNGYRGFLEKKGWLDFSSVMREKTGDLYKKNDLRSVVRIDIDGKKVFLKRHFKNAKPGLREWQNIFRLRSIGIPTMNPIAVGEKGEESFIITESLEPAERLEDFIKRDKLGFLEEKTLIHEIASLTKKMHKNNLFHKDFYAGHIFVCRENGTFKLYLIDIQRLRRHWLLRKRWRIKDLASLNFSSFGSNITDRNRLRFLWYYLNKDKLSKNKKMIKKIVRKTDRIARHTENLLRQRRGL